MDLALFLFQFPWVVGEGRRWESLWCEMLDKERAKAPLLYCGVPWLRNRTLPQSAPHPLRQTGMVLTRSPGFTEMATTTPGIGERKTLLVSSATFSSINLFNSAASLLRICTLYYKGGGKKKWDHMINFSSSNEAIVQNQFSAFKFHHLWSHIVIAHGSKTHLFASALCCERVVYEISWKRNESSNSLVTNSNHPVSLRKTSQNLTKKTEFSYIPLETFPSGHRFCSWADQQRSGCCQNSPVGGSRQLCQTLRSPETAAGPRYQ